MDPIKNDPKFASDFLRSWIYSGLCKYSEKLDVGLGWQSNSPTNGLLISILEGYPPEV